MGTSSSYKGSTSKVSSALRDGVDKWSQSQTDDTKTPVPESLVAQALKIPIFRRSSGDGPGSGGAGAGGGGGQGGGQKQSSPRRDARAYSSTASRAASLARAFREGDREALAKAGLDFDQLAALPSRSELVRAILDIVCGADMGSDIPAEEQREIAAHLLDWMLDTEMNPTPPDAVAVSEHAIGLIIAEMFLSEADEFTSTPEVTRAEFVEGVYESSQHLAARSNLSQASVSQQELDKAIQKGLKWLRRTYARDDG
ncbi:hypothetical protein [Pseudarthrobacter sp. NIBRBAC000502771]|uniref:hypothetical protein n=1 Tax=Pseudarthrobacter sp. NIBRBAC000502771 TaxID=2590774 RepID=UPI0011320836|nr:hypothetical protein [Pseudarthrobacter sp. NIBRBAC000502771]QDG63995.1 hypothetical protein NIBR502771_17875 [Pseudarthrobacter sp. NIBRBAC000502771]